MTKAYDSLLEYTMARRSPLSVCQHGQISKSVKAEEIDRLIENVAKKVSAADSPELALSTFTHLPSPQSRFKLVNPPVLANSREHPSGKA